MPTVDKKLADELVAKDGHYEDDPPVDLIIEYRNAFDGGRSYGIVYAGQPNLYTESQFIQEPKVYWSKRTN